MESEYYIGKDVKGSTMPDLKYYPGIYLEGLRKTTKYFRITVLGQRFMSSVSRLRNTSATHFIMTSRGVIIHQYYKRGLLCIAKWNDERG
jgi:hypothetical protein